jgi:hypothetical protein
MIAYAPLDLDEPRPPPYIKDLPLIKKPTMDDTECNYIVMLFVGAIFLMGIIDGFRN